MGKKYFLVTGCCGFIGFHLSRKLIKQGCNVVGIDNLNDYYDVNLKQSRLNKIIDYKNFHFVRVDIINKNNLAEVFSNYDFKMVLHFAAQAGVQFSVTNPSEYVNNNILGFFNIIDFCKLNKVTKIIYASSSSVYGNNKEFPFNEKHKVDKPKSFYAATKLSNELMAYTFHEIYDLSLIGLRLFTVYGPWGRPDMSYHIFVKSILEGKEIQLFNKGKQYRSFTYIDDIIKSILLLIAKLNNSKKIYKLFNIGSPESISLIDYIKIIEKYLNKTAKIINCDSIKGDMLKTEADSSLLYDYIGFKPQINIEEGLYKYTKWHRSYY